MPLTPRQKVALLGLCVPAIGAIIVAAINIVPSLWPKHESPTPTPAGSTIINSSGIDSPVFNVSGNGNTVFKDVTTVNEIREPPIRFPAEAKEKVIVDVSENSRFYKTSKTGSATTLQPMEMEFGFGLPSLDFKLVNNTDETIFVAKLLLSDLESTPDNRPELKWEKMIEFINEEFPLKITNDGWGPALDVVVSGEVRAQEERTAIPVPGISKKPFKFKLGNITESASIPLPELFRDMFGRSRPPMGTSYDLSGSLVYSYLGVEGKRESKEELFYVEVTGSLHARAYQPSTHRYGAELAVNKKNYEISCDVSQELQPKAADRFTVVLHAGQSSLHQFRLSLVYNHNQQIDLGIYRLVFYLPRSQVAQTLRLMRSTKSVSTSESPDE